MVDITLTPWELNTNCSKLISYHILNQSERGEGKMDSCKFVMQYFKKFHHNWFNKCKFHDINRSEIVLISQKYPQG